MALSWAEAAARAFEPPTKRWETPGELARFLNPKSIQTPALDLIDEALVEAYNTPDSRTMVFLGPQEGKAISLTTPIATPTGWTTMGELKVGDQVFGRDGKPCNVTWVSPIWTGRDCYAVRTGDGERIIADAAHEWVGKLDRRRPTEAIIETTVLARPRSKNAQIATAAPLDLPEADLPLDPYVLGAWLGDGHSAGPRFTSADHEVTDRIRSTGTPCRKMPSGKYLWSLAPEGGSSLASPVRKALIELGVLNNKHVPDIYMRASRPQRLALMQGLIDTDGHVSKRGQVEFTACNKRLADAVYELAYTLGVKATVTEGRATIKGKDCGPKWRVRFFMAAAAYMPRKADRCHDSRDAGVRYVWAEPVESEPTVCIEVDSPDHTFLVGRSLLPTHNSTRVAEVFPLWVLSQSPDTRIVTASYAMSLARRNGRAIRNHIETHGHELGIRIRPDVAAQSEWQLDGHRGGLYATGIGGGLTGRAADMMIIDDPHSGMETAESATYQEKAWDWWTGTASTRLAPGAPVILIMTRWSELDLAGRLLDAEDGNLWNVINIPAQADHNPDKGEKDPLGRVPGEFLESTRGRTDAQWEAIKKRAGSRVWNALYQGRPAPAEGGLFKRSEWKRYETPLWVEQADGSCVVTGATDQVLMSWDMTFKSTQNSDFVAGQVWLKRGPNAYLLDQVHRRMSFTETVAAVEALVAKWPQATSKLVEDAANGTAIIDVLRARVSGLIPIRPHESKEARAAAVTPFIEAGNIFLPSAQIAPWVEGLIEEAAAFPNGANDDQCDSLTQALNRLFIEANGGNQWLAYLRGQA